ncbi:hypothetical protein K493DRAFT_24231 [Basidiobolus meristosporus CBS 931.73]|uniref:Uncharacterized protein n=1 Tax=Basidiobolus meristosporus CBS 931.73 TaxID=1314790 RepID=A0A1Y1YCI6_9FUNG|nr:hypothetical protein K493DRAFT_24231 [Basidiobolus meristosporus CBS 931.73]|eukprot:ORX95645.1 hypothetical protein K493DRAFT_24231 [Basidiobolus meristosporus CBS 931.73]
MANMLDNIGRFIFDDNTELLNHQNDQDKEQLLDFFEALKGQIDLGANPPLNPEFQANDFSLDFLNPEPMNSVTNINLPDVSPAQQAPVDFTFDQSPLDGQFSVPYVDNLYPAPLYPSTDAFGQNMGACADFNIMQLPEELGPSNAYFTDMQVSQQSELIFNMQACNNINAVSVDNASNMLYPYLDPSSQPLYSSTLEQVSSLEQPYVHPAMSHARKSSVNRQFEASVPRLDSNLPNYTAISMLSQMSAPGEKRRPSDSKASKAPSKTPEEEQTTRVPPVNSGSDQRSATIHESRSQSVANKDRAESIPRNQKLSAADQKKASHFKLVDMIIQKLKATGNENSKPHVQSAASAKQPIDDEDSSDLMEKLQARLEAIRLGGKSA